MRAYLTLFFMSLSLGAARAEERLPDGEETRMGAVTAYLIAPTTRYSHGALGDAIEAGGFAVDVSGQTKIFMLPKDEVFEDLRVRLHDLDGDGPPEAIIIRSHVSKGASIAAYDIDSIGISLRAQSDYIGQANRWLNIVGFGDFTGEGKTMVAAVVTPHLQGSLRLYELVGDQLVERARIDGFTNHLNGTRELDLATLRDVNGDGIVDIMLPVLDGSSMAAVTFKGGQPRVLQP